MAVEVVLVVGFLSVLGVCVAVLVWDVKRRQLYRAEETEEGADLRLRIAELEKENQRLKEEVRFLEKLGRDREGSGAGR